MAELIATARRGARPNAAKAAERAFAEPRGVHDAASPRLDALDSVTSPASGHHVLGRADAYDALMRAKMKGFTMPVR